MKALTVSSEGNRVLKVGTGGLASFVLDNGFSCATPNKTSRRTTEQQKAKRCMSSFPKIICKTFSTAHLSRTAPRFQTKTNIKGGGQECPPHIFMRRFWQQWENGARSQRPSAKFSVRARPAGACIRRDPPSGSPFAPAPDHSRDRRQSAPRRASPLRILQGSYLASRRVAASQGPSDRGAIPPMAAFPDWPPGSPPAANSHTGSGDSPASWARPRSQQARLPYRRTACSIQPPVHSCFRC